MHPYDNRSIPVFAKCRLYGGALLLALACGPVAADVQSPAFERFRAQVVGNNVNFSYGGAGTPLAGSGNATGIGVSSGVDVERGTRLNTKHGAIAGTLKQKLSSPAMAKAMRALRVGGALVTPAGIAFLALPAIVDYLQSGGVAADENGELTQEVTYQNCQVSWANSAPYTLTRSSCLAAAQAVFALMVANNASHPSQIVSCNSTQQNCGISWTGAQPWSPEFFVTPVGAPYTESEPIDPAQLEAALSVVANPTPEALAELYKLAEPLNLGSPIPDLVDTLRAEFEARSPESVTTETTQSPSETKTEEKTCATYTQVVGSTLSLVEQCETVTTTQPKDPETGLPVGDPTTTTKTTTDGTPDPKADPATSEEAKQEDPCIANPTRVGCATLDTQDGDIPTSERTVTYAPENVSLGTGTCPAPITFNTTRGTNTLDVEPWCDTMENVMRPLFLLIAAFSAFFIVAPVWSNPS